MKLQSWRVNHNPCTFNVHSETDIILTNYDVTVFEYKIKPFFLLITKSILSLYKRIIHRLTIVVKTWTCYFFYIPKTKQISGQTPNNRKTAFSPHYVYLILQTQSSSSINLPASNAPNFWSSHKMAQTHVFIVSRMKEKTRKFVLWKIQIRFILCGILQWHILSIICARV
jgi:hypothetical protein